MRTLYYKKIIGLIAVVISVFTTGFFVAPTFAATDSGDRIVSNSGIGSSGRAVIAIQRLLLQSGYLTIPANTNLGYFGGLTRSAVIAFQQANGIFPSSGFVGPLTREALNRLVDSSGPLVVVSPKQNDAIVSPLRVAGVVNANEWPCTDGTVGNATLFDGVGKQIGQTTLTVPAGCGEASAFVFEGTINFGTAGTDTGYVVVSANQQNRVSQRISVRFPSTAVNAPVFTAPIGGERLIQKSTFAVRWTGGPSQINLQLISGNNTIAWQSGAIDNAGSYNFVVPENLTGAYKFALTDTSVILGYSNTFSIGVAAPMVGAVSITAPSTGTQWENGSQQSITWTGDIPKLIALSSACEDKTLSVINTETGKRYPISVLTPEIIDARAYRWQVGFSVSSLCVDKPFLVPIPAGNYQVELAWFERTQESLLIRRKVVGGVFRIIGTQANITVTAPAGADNWLTGNSYEIKWRTNGPISDNVNTATISLIPLRPACLNSVPPCKIAEPAPYIIATNAPATGSYKWTIPTDLPDIYREAVRISVAINGTDRVGISDQFTISNVPMQNVPVTVLAPAGGEQWSVGTKQVIRWKADASIAAVDIVLLQQVDACLASVNSPCPPPPFFLKVIAEKVPNTGNYEWVVPSGFSGSLRVRVSDTTSPSRFGISNSSFTIVSAGIPVYLDQKFILKTGQTATVQDLKNIQVTLNGVTSLPCTDSIRPCATSAAITVAATGEQTKNTTLSVGGSVDIGGGTVFLLAIDATNQSGTFLVRKSAIAPTGTITVVSPNGGESLTQGLVGVIAWKADSSITSVNISLIAQSGCLGGPTGNNCPTVETKIADGVLNTGSYFWTIGKDINGNSVPTGSYLVKISNAKGGVSDTSDGAVTIVASSQSASITLLSPKGGEVVRAGDPTSALLASWITSPVANSWVALFLISATTGSQQLIAQRLDSGQGSYAWTPSASLASGNYKMEARLYSGPSLCTGQICTDVAPPKLLASATTSGYITVLGGSTGNIVQLNQKFILGTGENATVQSNGTNVVRVTFLEELCAPPRVCVLNGGRFRVEVLASGISSDVVILPGSAQKIGNYTVTLSAFGQSQATLVVSNSTTANISVNSTSNMTGSVGNYFQAVFDAVGGVDTGHYGFAITSGALPSGLTFGQIIPSCAPPAPGIIATCPFITSALLNGTPTQAGTFTFEITATDAAGNKGKNTFTVTISGGTPAPIATSACNQQLIIPAYFYPGALWDQSINSRTSGEIMIMNPNSGPGASVDQNYVASVLRAKAAGIRVIGYVHTSYGLRSSIEVKSEIDKFKLWYNVDGIFLDEGATDPVKLSYYKDIQSYIQQTMPGKVIVINPGVVPDEGYMSVADIVMIFEDTYGAYKTWSPPAWVSKYAPSRFAHLVHATASEADMKDAATLAFKRRGGYAFITNDLLPNPWDSLPPYYASQVAQLSGSSCVATTPVKTGVSATASTLDTLLELVKQLQALVK